MKSRMSIQIADSIEGVTRALAEWTVSRHLEFDAQLPEKYGVYWRSEWVGHVESRLRLLIQAVALERPELFASAMRWTADAHQDEGEGREDLALSLKAMRDVIRDELPPPMLDAINRCLDAGIAALSPGASVPGGANAGSVLDKNEPARQFMQAVLAGDERRAAEIVNNAIASGVSAVEVYTAILQPAMHEVGVCWYRGDMSVAQEHLATATTRDLMARLRAQCEPADADARRVVAATVAGDFHDLGLRMATDLLEYDGWRTWFLGANVPTNVLIEFLKHSTANLLLLSVSTTLHLRGALETIGAIREDFLGTRLKILVGGHPLDVVPDLWRDLGADGCAGHLGELTARANELVPLKR